jgi:RNA-directed DNA polymerase
MVLYKFLYLRGLYLTRNSIYFDLFSSFEGFTTFGWFFKVFRFYSVVGRAENKCLKIQKTKLKSVIKNFNNLPVIKLIKYLNLLISNWSNIYNLTDFLYDTCNELDIYLNKLLWKWARRRHPRRPNVWIYSRYWKCFLGKWKFFNIGFSIEKIISLLLSILIKSIRSILLTLGP